MGIFRNKHFKPRKTTMPSFLEWSVEIKRSLYSPFKLEKLMLTNCWRFPDLIFTKIENLNESLQAINPR